MDLWLGKRIFLKLKNQTQYTGLVLKEGDDFLILLDKFQEAKFVSFSDIEILHEDLKFKEDKK
jgi:hypothetical protein